MIGRFTAEAVMAAGYAIFLALVAVVLELVARHSHRRAHQFRTAGFHYDWHSDAWQCPAGQRLTRIEPDSLKDKVARYRAPARVCNACPLKVECTDSDEGRELHSLHPWIDSELGRFHRGISVALLLLAAMILGIEMVRNRTQAELALLLTVLASIGMVGGRFIPALMKR